MRFKSQVATLAAVTNGMSVVSDRITNKKGGKVITMIKAVYGIDGKHRVETVTGTSAQGQAIKNVTSWDKQ